MKALFAVDHIFAKTLDGKIYTIGGKFPYSAWSTYLSTFSDLTIISRARDVTDVTNLESSEGPGVAFQLMPDDRGFKRLRSIRSTRRIVDDLVASVDVVIARVPSEIALLACDSARHQGKPYLVEVVACPWDALWNHGAITAKLYAPIFTRRNKLAIRKAPLVRYVSKSFLQGRYPTLGEQYVASNVQLTGSSKVKKFTNFNNKFGTIGALHTKLKGIDVAIRALSLVKISRPDLNFEYRVLGEGSPASLKILAKELGIGDSVYFDGVLPPGGAVADWLDNIDFYLQPSYQEGLPRALIEALSRGCVSAGSTAGGTPELLISERLHKPGDYKNLARIIIEMLDRDSSQLENESKNNEARSRQFSADQMYFSRLSSLKALREMHGAVD